MKTVSMNHFGEVRCLNETQIGFSKARDGWWALFNWSQPGVCWLSAKLQTLAPVA